MRHGGKFVHNCLFGKRADEAAFFGAFLAVAWNVEDAGTYILCGTYLSWIYAVD